MHVYVQHVDLPTPADVNEQQAMEYMASHHKLCELIATPPYIEDCLELFGESAPQERSWASLYVHVHMSVLVTLGS